MCAIWGFKLRKDENWSDDLERAYCDIEEHSNALVMQKKRLKTSLMDGGVLDEQVRKHLVDLIESVHRFEQICQQSGPSEDNDTDAALAFFDLGSSIESASDQLNTQISEQRLRILVVDDRLLLIDRLQSHKIFQNRFAWVTRCNEHVECRDCPKRANCAFRRSRNYSETVSALELAASRGQKVDALLMDVRFDDLTSDELEWIPELPDLNREERVKSLQGLIIARRLRQIPGYRSLPMVLMTARSRLPEGAANLMEGLDGLQFVDDDDSLDVLAARLESVVRMCQESLVEQGYFWGASSKIQHTRRQIEIMSQGPRTVFISGPSGSGKSSLVEKIIYPLSGRKSLVTLDLSSIPDTLVESELFGHIKGAYSGATHDRMGLIEEADGGILFLDEIGNLSMENQRKLLLFLQDKMVRRVGAPHESRKKVDVKVVVATHLDLAEEVAAGRFRFDLMMRFGPAMRITLPSLHDRIEDLPQLIDTLVKKIITGEEMKPYLDAMRKRSGGCQQIRVDFLSSNAGDDDDLCVRFKTATCELFMAYGWPGNTRELESVLDTLILKAFYDLQISSSKSHVIEIDHYYALSLLGGIKTQGAENPTEITNPVKQTVSGYDLGVVQDFSELRQTLEKKYLSDRYAQCDGDLGRMGMMLFGDDSDQMKHKISVRMNQLGLRIRSMKKK